MFCTYILEYNLPYMQSGCWCIQSNMRELHLRKFFLLAIWVQSKSLELYFEVPIHMYNYLDLA